MRHKMPASQDITNQLSAVEQENIFGVDRPLEQAHHHLAIPNKTSVTHRC